MCLSFKCPKSTCLVDTLILFSLHVSPKRKAIVGTQANVESTKGVAVAALQISDFHGDWNTQHPGALLFEKLTVLSED